MTGDAATETMPQPRCWLTGGETLMRLLAERRELGEPKRTGRRPNATLAVTTTQLATLLDDCALLAGDGERSPATAAEWQARELLADALTATADELAALGAAADDADALASAWARRLPQVTDGVPG